MKFTFATGKKVFADCLKSMRLAFFKAAPQKIDVDELTLSE